MSNIKDIGDRLKGMARRMARPEGNPSEESKSEKSPDEMIKSFLKDTQRWEVAYSASDLFATVARYAKKAGLTTIYYSLLIYEALISDRISGLEKTLAMAALGYFISPLDIISDFLPGGLFDDTVILFYGIDKISEAIDAETENRARIQLSKWFSDSEIIELSKADVENALKLKDMFKTPIKMFAAPVKILKGSGKVIKLLK